MPEALLSGFRVIEIGHPYTEYAGLVLASLGAEVFLVEPPEGAETRHRNPRVADSGSSLRGSIPFLARNMNKQSLVIDPADSGDLAKLTRLCERANVVLDTDRSVYHETIEAAKTSSTVTITDKRNLGTSSIVGFAASGGQASSGWPQQPPCNAPSWMALDGVGVYAAVLSVITEIGRRQGATDIHYELPFEETIISAITPWTRTLHSYEMQANGQGSITARLGETGFPTYKASDGYVRALAATPGQWQAFVELMGNPEELVDGPWAEPEFRAENMDALFLICSQYTADRTMREMFEEGQQLGLTITPVYSLEQFRADPHVKERELLVPVVDPEFGEMELVRPPHRIQPDHYSVPIKPAPALDDCSEEALTIFDTPLPVFETQKDFQILQPLNGLRVLELGFGAVVPEAAELLAAFGADVIKLESQVHPDFLRLTGLAGFMDVNNSPTFNQLNLGTKSIAVDMVQPEGRELIHRLAESSDMIMDNMRGKIAERWGLDYPAARELREDVIYFCSQGLGHGPYADYQTYGPNLQTFSALTSQWAHPDDPHPVGSTLNHPDHVAGKQALVTLLAALLRREEENTGCFVEAAQFETAAFFIGDRFLQQYLSGKDPTPLGNSSVDLAPHGCYPCIGEDRWIVIAIENDNQWTRLAEIVGEDWVTDDKFSHKNERLKHAEEIDEHLCVWTATFEVDELESLLRDAGLSVSRVMTGDDFAADEELNQSGIFPAISHPTAGLRQYTGTPMVLKGLGRHPTRRPPLLGEHTESVLYDILKISPERMDFLHMKKIIGF